MVLTAEETRADVLELLHLLNADAKTMSRRGYVGTRSAQYAKTHGHIDDALDMLEAVAHGCELGSARQSLVAAQG